MENKVTLEQIESKIKAECYLVLPDGKSTICILSMQNGYTIKGLSACVDASNFDMETGRKIAREDAIRQIWPLEGYLLAQSLYEVEKSLEGLPPNEMTADGWVTNPIAKKTVLRLKKARRGRPAKNAAAPYGYKKDGTPKKRPGRPAK